MSLKRFVVAVSPVTDFDSGPKNTSEPSTTDAMQLATVEWVDAPHELERHGPTSTMACMSFTEFVAVHKAQKWSAGAKAPDKSRTTTMLNAALLAVAEARRKRSIDSETLDAWSDALSLVGLRPNKRESIMSILTDMQNQGLSIIGLDDSTESDIYTAANMKEAYAAYRDATTLADRDARRL